MDCLNKKPAPVKVVITSLRDEH